MTTPTMDALRHAISMVCENRRSFSADQLECQFSRPLSDRFTLPADWQARYTKLLFRMRNALARLQEMYAWGHIDRPEYLHKQREFESQLQALTAHHEPVRQPNLHRAALLLRDVGALWLHEGVSDERRKEFVEEVFEKILLDERGIRRVTPRRDYLGLIAIADLCGGGIWSGRLELTRRVPPRVVSLDGPLGLSRSRALSRSLPGCVRGALHDGKRPCASLRAAQRAAFPLISA